MQQVLNETAKSLKEDERNIEDAIKRIDELRMEAEKIGGKLDKSYFEPFLAGYADAQKQLREGKELQGFKDLLPSLDDYNLKIKEIQISKEELTAVEQLNNQINLLQLDTLALANPALAEHIRLLRERAGELDATTQKQKDQENSFGANFTEKFKSYYDSITNLGAQVGDAVTSSLQGLEDALTDFVTTGKANFADLAKSILADLARIAIQQAIIKPLTAGLGDFFGFKPSAKGNVFAQNGIQAFARGGVVDKPTLFPFAKGTGLMGEAGPEAIMPLKRGADGKLGVAADMTGAMARYQRQGGGDDNEPDPVAAMARYQRQDGGIGNMGGNRNTTNNANSTTNNGYDNNSDTVNNIQTSPSPVLALSFETTRFLGQDYVSTDQLQAAMLATEKRAAASGAKAGAAQVAAQMRNSPGYRRQVGLR